MGRRRLVPRTATPGAPVPALPAAAMDRTAPRETPEDLPAAWTELIAAAKGSKVVSFHACTRTGRPWAEDPVAVRDIAATLREFPGREDPQTTGPR